jgi:hypothetical protein
MVGRKARGRPGTAPGHMDQLVRSTTQLVSPVWWFVADVREDRTLIAFECEIAE